MLLLAAAVAWAGVTFERPPEKDEEGALGGAPLSTQVGEYRKWREKSAKRARYASLDALLRWRAPQIDKCVRERGAMAELGASMTVSVGNDGVLGVKGTGEDALSACVVALLHDAPTALPVTRDFSLDYTARWTPADPPAAAPPAPSALAFAPKLDDEHGFGHIDLGTLAASLEGMTAVNHDQGTSFYTRPGDQGLRWFGAPVFGASYAFDPSGFYAVTLGVVGTTTTWKLREALTAHYGQPRWDNRFGAYFWRGERMLLQFRPVTGSENVTITLLDIPRARASGVADTLPGDPYDPTAPDTNRRLPRIFQEK